jgi:putative tryptophan/tyrosine transport system substrate-binding protein
MLDLRRRQFLTLLLGGAAAAWPLTARAQQPATPVIGFLYFGWPDAKVVASFHKGLNETGYFEGRNLAIEFRSARNDTTRLPELAADLVRRQVATIAAPSGTAALAATAATKTIPVVFNTAGDPVQMGLVASLNRPGGNVTGVANMHMEITAKRLGILRELLPKAARFAVLVNPSSQNAKSEITEAQEAGLAIGRQIDILTAGTDREISMAFASLMQKRVDALVVGPHSFFRNRRAQLLTLAARYAVPTIFSYRDDAEAGGLMSYGSTFDEYHQVGIYLGRILKGEKPADLPVMQASKFEFIINLQTAKALDIDIPSTLLALADEVIE